MRAYKNPIARYPKFYNPQGEVVTLDPSAANNNKKASISNENTTQNTLIITLVNILLTKAKKPNRVVTNIKPANWHA